MRALRLYEGGLRVEEIELPEPGPGEVLVRVHAAAITRDELTWRTDRLPAIPSYELSGAVVDLPQLGAHERPALARLHVLEVHDPVDRPIDLDMASVLELIGADHGR